MRLSWNEIRARAASFTDEWRDAAYEKGEPHSFYNDFFEIFGVRRRSVGRYEEHVRKLDNRSGFIDLFWLHQLPCVVAQSKCPLLRPIEMSPLDQVGGRPLRLAG